MNGDTAFPYEDKPHALFFGKLYICQDGSWRKNQRGDGVQPLPRFLNKKWESGIPKRFALKFLFDIFQFHSVPLDPPILKSGLASSLDFRLLWAFRRPSPCGTA